MTDHDDLEDFYEAEELARTESLSPNYEPDDFSFRENKGFPRHQRGKLLDFDLSLEQLRSHIDPNGDRLGQNDRLRQAWEAVAGPSVAAHTKNLFLRGDELIVWLDSNLFAQQLPLFADEYLAGLARELGARVVTSISYRLDRHRRR
ncbi:MAG: DUF721 domain-containing protein [Actinomycetia bacterium]|nr:DUF721 domain-containing protein [Actinomycetes bacterium]